MCAKLKQYYTCNFPNPLKKSKIFIGITGRIRRLLLADKRQVHRTTVRYPAGIVTVDLRAVPPLSGQALRRLTVVPRLVRSDRRFVSPEELAVSLWRVQAYPGVPENGLVAVALRCRPECI